MRAITILFVLVTTSFVHAQALVIRTEGMICTPNSCQKVTGTGACVFVGNIDDRSIYVTAAHNLKGNPKVYVGYGGQWWGARTAYQMYQGNVDYAVIETRKINSTKCFEIAASRPVDGVDAVAYGYSNGIYNLRVLRARIRVNRNGRVFSKIVAKGDSGGPIIVNNQVVGIIQGHDYRNTIYTDGVLIRQQLIKLYGRLPSCGSPVVVIEDETAEPNQPEQNVDLSGLEGEISTLRAQLDQLKNTQIPVEIYNAEGKVISKQTYPLGSAIKLRFKAVKK